MKNLEIVKVGTVGSGFGPRGSATLVIYVKPDLPENEVRNIAGMYHEEMLRYDHPLRETLTTEIREVDDNKYQMRFNYMPRHDANVPQNLKLMTKDELMGFIKPYVEKFEAVGREYMRVLRVVELVRKFNPAVYATVHNYQNYRDMKPWSIEFHVNQSHLPEYIKDVTDRGNIWTTKHFTMEEIDAFTEDDAKALYDSLLDEVRLDMKINKMEDAIRTMMANCECARLFHYKVEPTKVTFTSVYAREKKHEIVASNIDELMLTAGSLNCSFLQKLGESWGIVETEAQKADRIAKESLYEVKRKAADTAERKRQRQERDRIEVEFQKLATSLQTP